MTGIRPGPSAPTTGTGRLIPHAGSCPPTAIRPQEAAGSRQRRPAGGRLSAPDAATGGVAIEEGGRLVAQHLQSRVRRRAIAFVRALARGLRRDDRGMTTVEYAVGTLVAAALAAVLYRIVTGDSIVKGLTSLITRALGIV